VNRSVWFGWWYMTIAVGFLLLALQRILTGGVRWLIVLRIIIAAGFFLLGWAELKGKLRR
jgi:hypothetical protein